jgi:hypothetical protein
MKQTVYFNNFVDAFTRVGRGDQFSYAGLRSLFDHIEEWEDETGEQIELDVIALCCDWEEYDAEELLMQFGDWIERYDGEDDADFAERLVDELEGIRGTVIRGDDTYIVSK